MKSIHVLFIPLFSILLIGCENKGVEKLISDYEQKIGDTKTDLNLQIIKLEKVRSISTGDSLKLIRKKFKELIGEEKSTLDTFQYITTVKFVKENILRYNKFIENEKERMKSPYYSSHYSSGLEYIKKYQDKIENAETALKVILELSKMDSIYRQSDSLKILSNEYKCTYSIKNPFLNNVKQEITNSYFVNTSLTTIQSKSEN